MRDAARKLTGDSIAGSGEAPLPPCAAAHDRAGAQYVVGPKVAISLPSRSPTVNRICAALARGSPAPDLSKLLAGWRRPHGLHLALRTRLCRQQVGMLTPAPGRTPNHSNSLAAVMIASQRYRGRRPARAFVLDDVGQDLPAQPALRTPSLRRGHQRVQAPFALARGTFVPSVSSETAQNIPATVPLSSWTGEYEGEPGSARRTTCGS